MPTNQSPGPVCGQRMKTCIILFFGFLTRNIFHGIYGALWLKTSFQSKFFFINNYSFRCKYLECDPSSRDNGQIDTCPWISRGGNLLARSSRVLEGQFCSSGRCRLFASRKGMRRGCTNVEQHPTYRIVWEQRVALFDVTLEVNDSVESSLSRIGGLPLYFRALLDTYFRHSSGICSWYTWPIGTSRGSLSSKILSVGT